MKTESITAFLLPELNMQAKMLHNVFLNSRCFVNIWYTEDSKVKYTMMTLWWQHWEQNIRPHWRQWCFLRRALNRTLHLKHSTTSLSEIHLDKSSIWFLKVNKFLLSNDYTVQKLFTFTNHKCAQPTRIHSTCTFWPNIGIRITVRHWTPVWLYTLIFSMHTSWWFVLNIIQKRLNTVHIIHDYII